MAPSPTCSIENFVSIKVDREERPDVDRVYMTFVQATTGAGGWPMSVWLTPQLKPFYGGTYFPPASRWGRPGFIDVLRQLARAWRDERPRVIDSADDIVARLKVYTESTRSSASGGVHSPPGTEVLRQSTDEFRATFDRRHGGFGHAPKFPRPSELLFLLREYARTRDAELIEVVMATLGAMAFGGMRDHLGGGFHRYSVDPAWRVPHFEKMLYDQAQLVLAYLEAGQATGDPVWNAVAEDTLAYVARDLTHADGGFYSAEDADSVAPELANEPRPRKTEGAFYLWPIEEVRSLLGADAPIVVERFGLLPGGNAPSDPQEEFGTKNLLYIARTIDEIASRTGRPADDVEAVLGRARRILFEARSARPRPHLDDKVLAAWNGLMIAAAARAARVLDDGRDPEGERRAGVWLDAARRAASAARRHLWQPDSKRLLRRYRDGDAAIDGFCEDYACLAWGLLELFQAGGDPDDLAWAIELQQTCDRLFWDEENGGWFSTSGADASVLLRLKEDYDGAEPSASSVAVMNALTLAHLGVAGDFEARAVRTLARLGADAGPRGRVVPLMFANLSIWHQPVAQVVLVGAADDSGLKELRRAVASAYRPATFVIPVAPGPRQTALARLLPFVAPMTERDGRATAYVCEDFVCRAPVTDAGELVHLLSPRRVLQPDSDQERPD